MKGLFILSVLLFPLFGTPAFGDFAKGMEAYSGGDFKTAVKEFKPLAEQGDALAQTALGAIYFNGWGVPQNYGAAFKWWKLAASQGEAAAQFHLALMYDDGLGVPENDNIAVDWYTLAAHQGLEDAQYNLGAMYAEGEGVLQDYIRSHMWFNVAASQGLTQAISAREMIQKSMTPAQIAEAQKLARECVAKNYKNC